MSKEKNLVRIKKSKNSNTIFGLPAKSYIDENFWKKECETVLSNGWLFVGFAHELKNPGDIIVLAGKGHEKFQEINGEKTPFEILYGVHNVAGAELIGQPHPVSRNSVNCSPFC